MKNRLSVILASFFLLAMLSCKKEEHKIYYEGGTAPFLSVFPYNAPLVLQKANKDNNALKFQWTNPNYSFTTGLSSQDVTYILQFDTAGVNFSSPNKQEMSIAKDLGVTLTVKDLNTLLTKMELPAGISYNMEIRVKSVLTGNTVPLYSNVIKLQVTPYLDFAVEPPGTAANNYEDGNLWVTGDCFPGADWTNPLPSPEDVNNKFTKIDKLHYELVITFDKTGGYKMIQEQGNWDTQYHALVANTPLSGEFEKKNSDPQFASPGAGKYKIEVNFQTGKYKLTPQ